MSKYAAKGSIATKYKNTISMSLEEYEAWVESGEPIEVTSFYSGEVLGVAYPDAESKQSVTRGRNPRLIRVINYERHQ